MRARGRRHGKTRAITHRIAYGIATGVYTPQKVLALTFTARAANEGWIREGADNALGVRGRNGPRGGRSMLGPLNPHRREPPSPLELPNRRITATGAATAAGATSPASAAMSATLTVPSAIVIRSRICQSESRILHRVYCSPSFFCVVHAVNVRGASMAWLKSATLIECAARLRV